MNHKTNNADWRGHTCGECIHGSPEKLLFWYGLTESEAELVISGNESILPHKVANGIGCGTEKRGCVFETFSPACPAFVAREEAQPHKCAWRQDEYTGAYHTACGHLWEFTEGGLVDNDTRYCPYCGGQIVEQPTEGEEEPNPNTYRKILGAHPDLPDLEHNR